MYNSTFEIQETIMEDFFKQNNIESCAVFLANAEVGNLYIYGCKFISPKSEFNKLNMTTLKVCGYLHMKNDSVFGEVDLLKANIGGQIIISNSKFKGKLNMDSLEVRGDLIMRGNLKFAVVDIHNAEIGGQLEIKDAKFNDILIMSSLKVKGELTMNNNTFEIQETIMKDFFTQNKLEPFAVSLANAEVGNLKIYGCKFISPKKEFNKLNMKTLKVYGYLQMEDNSEFGEVDLLRAKIEGQVIISNSKFKDTLNMQFLELSGDFIIRSKVKFSVVDLRGAEIGGLFEITDAKFNDKLDMSFIKVNINVIIQNTFENKVLLPFANVGQNLDISSSKFSSLDLGSAQINGELQLFSENDQPTSTQWEKGANLYSKTQSLVSLKIHKILGRII
jgi:predicted aspartyl protease/peroxiredoxin family protein